MALACAIAALCCVPTGCLSFGARVMQNQDDFVVYPGVAAHRYCWGFDDVNPLWILDLPLSFAFDTALLPLDLLTWPMRPFPDEW